ncbi:MAG TPA: hypothetical protein PKI03_33650, partial [Pseudomonadota bacterium]|nr:hypothetical protein [Pseudomonadota bacterium]
RGGDDDARASGKQALHHTRKEQMVERGRKRRRKARNRKAKERPEHEAASAIAVGKRADKELGDGESQL